jgi:hypothetical protein
VAFSIRNYEETGLCRLLDIHDNDVCTLGNLFSLSEQQSYGEDLPYKGSQARGPFVPILVSPLCRRA